MNLITSYNSPQKICHAIQRAIQSEFPKLVARPYNMYEPETTLWWLVPSSEWPAYKYGKMYFNWADDGRNQIWAGFHSEKGLGESVSGAYAKRKASHLIMADDWQWFDLLRYMSSGEFANTAKRVISNVALSFHLRLTGEYVERPACFEPYASPLKRDEYVFRWNPQTLKLDLVLAKPEAKVLGQLEEMTSFEQFAHHLTLLTTNDWVWVNFTFVVPFICKPGASNQEDVWPATDIWTNLLRPFTHLWF